MPGPSFLHVHRQDCAEIRASNDLRKRKGPCREAKAASIVIGPDCSCIFGLKLRSVFWLPAGLKHFESRRAQCSSLNRQRHRPQCAGIQLVLGMYTVLLILFRRESMRTCTRACVLACSPTCVSTHADLCACAHVRWACVHEGL